MEAVISEMVKERPIKKIGESGMTRYVKA